MIPFKKLGIITVTVHQRGIPTNQPVYIGTKEKRCDAHFGGCHPETMRSIGTTEGFEHCSIEKPWILPLQPM